LSFQRQDELAILKIISSQKVAPWQIAERSQLNIAEIQKVVMILLEKGLVAKTFDDLSKLLGYNQTRLRNPKC
jgi:predicted transcriptional regulator